MLQPTLRDLLIFHALRERPRTITELLRDFTNTPPALFREFHLILTPNALAKLVAWYRRQGWVRQLPPRVFQQKTLELTVHGHELLTRIGQLLVGDSPSIPPETTVIPSESPSTPHKRTSPVRSPVPDARFEPFLALFEEYISEEFVNAHRSGLFLWVSCHTSSIARQSIEDLVMDFCENFYPGTPIDSTLASEIHAAVTAIRKQIMEIKDRE
jgi:hypothetical protein